MISEEREEERGGGGGIEVKDVVESKGKENVVRLETSQMGGGEGGAKTFEVFLFTSCAK